MVNIPNSDADDINDAPAHIAPHMGAQEYLDIAGKDLHDFDNKKIVDIGGGAGLLDLYIQNNASPKQIIIADPAFQKRSFEDVVKRAKGTFENFATLEPTSLREKKKQLEANYKTENSLFDALNYTQNQYQPSSEAERFSEMNRLNRANDLLKRDIKRMETNKENDSKNVEIFDKYLKGEYAGVEINDSLGEKIVGVENDSQDVIFINHLLHKLPDAYYTILKEEDRILAPNGEIIVIEYDHRPDVYKDFFRQICDDAGVVRKVKNGSICVKFKKGEYVKLKPESF